MHKVFNSCYPLDSRCYKEYGLSEDILMEHAGLGMANYIRKHFSKKKTILLVIGVGNNGADGLVLVRQLFKEYTMKLYMPFELHSTMAKLQLERAKKIGITFCSEIKSADIVIDCLFGAGLNKALDKKTSLLIKELNSVDAFKIACDIPTGLGQKTEVFKANVTLTMGARKEILYLDKHKDCVGKIKCIDLGIHPTLYEMKSSAYLLEKKDLRLPLRKKEDSHKGTFGHAGIFCGEKEGAGVLSALSATSFGAGLTTLIVSKDITIPYYLMSSKTIPKNCTALAIGMGLGDVFEKEFLEKNSIESSLPIVLDADSFTNKGLLSILEQKNREIVITPHPKEFSLMWEIVTNEKLSIKEVQDKRFEIVRKFGEKYPHITLLLKGANMLIGHKGELYINTLGSSTLSKGGSGDVLSGLIVALLAQGYNSLQATIHASLAFTLASKKYKGASYALLPMDLIENIRRLN